MTTSATPTVSAKPRLAPHMRLRFDEVRNSWTIQAPERIFMLDAIAYEIVSRCDGDRSVHAIVDDLCIAFGDAPRNVIEEDVIKLIQGFVEKGVMAQ